MLYIGPTLAEANAVVAELPGAVGAVGAEGALGAQRDSTGLTQ